MLLDLRENSKITTVATYIQLISEKITHILRLDLKIFVNKIKKSTQEIIPKENIDFVSDTILNSEQRAHSFWSVKNLAERRYFPVILKQKTYIEPVEKIIGYDYKSGKPDCGRIYSNTFNMKSFAAALGYTRNCVYATALK